MLLLRGHVGKPLHERVADAVRRGRRSEEEIMQVVANLGWLEMVGARLTAWRMALLPCFQPSTIIDKYVSGCRQMRNDVLFRPRLVDYVFHCCDRERRGAPKGLLVPRGNAV